MRDFNARIGKEIPGGDRILNSNGERLLEFKDNSNLSILNCTEFCKGKITWRRNKQQSTIDYLLCSNALTNYVNNLLIDEERMFNFGSDHCVLWLTLNNLDINKPIPTKNNKTIWNIKPDQDYSSYRTREKFDNWDVNEFDTVDSIWESWKDKLIEAATEGIGLKISNSKLKPWFDKEIDIAIKDRKKASREHFKKYWENVGKANMDLTDNNAYLTARFVNAIREEFSNDFMNVNECTDDTDENNDILSEVQGGFSPSHRCEDHVFVLKSVEACRLQQGKHTYLAFQDFRKAFDSVWRDGLKKAVWNPAGIRGKVWRIIDRLYCSVKSKVCFGSIKTDIFDVEQGVKQGCVFSPILFNMFMNEFTKILKSNGLGTRINDEWVGSLFWADDIVLLANIFVLFCLAVLPTLVIAIF
ncbi:uncharacterized protein LOC117124657 [Anneissia japonica]|uniref:uncharacterized protein LOC117124657 n=1 Tax=Anneissia japonica TaxID=1529436 RepID=UPI0014258645|nr:uncharacterized protein LOC117124657 [Anneissia japonica]